MAFTALFFGTSNTRGFGVLPEHRYAAVLERSLQCTLDGRWQFVVATSPGDLGVFGEKLAAALTRHRPDLVVVQCPTSPASYSINYPRWLNALRGLHARRLRWHKERAIAAEIDGDPSRQRTRRDALREGLYLDPVYSLRLGRWAAVRRLRAAAVRRYGLIVNMTGEQYVDSILRLRRTVRASTQAPTLFWGLLPLSENLYPGYHQRARDWSSELAKHVPDEARRCYFVDVMGALAAVSSRELLLNDETHLSISGHGRVADVLLPELRCLIEDFESGPGLRSSVATPVPPSRAPE